MRIKNSIKNIYISILTQLVIALLGFFSRKVFIDNLGTQYLGVNGLLTNILSMLSLVEGGIGVSIVYNLYKPLANNDKPKIIALVQLYKKIYFFLSIGIFLLSCGLYPFLGILIKKDSTISYIGIVYFIFVIKNMISYLNAHKWSLINADQKGYILANYNLIFNVVTTISKIIVLKTTQNYILYLLIECLIFIIQNVWNGKIVNKKYSYIKTKEKFSVEKDVKNSIIRNVKALFLHNIGSYCVFGTDNLLIGTFININTVGLYSNYTMVISQLKGILTTMLNGIANSVGNLIATESKAKIYDIFNVVNYICFFIYGMSVVVLYNLLEDFITFWLGDGLLLNKLTFYVILINFYITGMRNSISIFKSKGGIFVQDKYVPLIEAVINLVSSIILVRYIGLAGIFLGTTISNILIPVWIQSKLVYNNLFEKSVIEYFKKYVLYTVLMSLAVFISRYVCNTISLQNIFISLVVRGIICIIICLIVFITPVLKSKEIQYLYNVLKQELNKYINKSSNKLKSANG